MKFILTKELGKLARWIRIFGFDATYYTSEAFGSLIIEALRDDRVIITRCKKKIAPLEKKTVVITSDNILRQLQEVIQKLGLSIDKNMMFTRCVVCNRLLEEVQKREIKDKVPAYVFETHTQFMHCPECKRIYWEGSHWGNIRKTLESIMQ